MRRDLSVRLGLAVFLGAALAAASAISAQRSAAGAMTTAAERFLASLDQGQRQQAAFALDASERLRWNFIPSEAFPRNGLLLKDMTEPQRTAAHNLLKSGLSERGYLTYTQIIQLENVLKALEQGGKFVRDPDGYRFTIFGTPSPKGAWGWRVEGHHISLHFSIVDGTAVASTPTFAGSNPAEVPEGPQKGRRVLGLLEDSGRALVTALDQSQREIAVITATAPNEIVTSNTLDISPLSPEGLKASAMTAGQRDLLMRVVDAYAGLMAPDIAAERLSRIKGAGIENIAFAWAGPTERGQRHYYRVQGPTFLIEFDNAQNDGNHVHSVWRDFNGDFGRDLLREHIRTARHE
jgi:hypothetical protein